MRCALKFVSTSQSQLKTSTKAFARRIIAMLMGAVAPNSNELKWHPSRRSLGGLNLGEGEGRLWCNGRGQRAKVQLETECLKRGQRDD